jgi:hypothetical protein
MKLIKWVLPLILVGVLLIPGSCTRGVPTVSKLYPPAVSDVTIAVSDTSSGIKVDFLVTNTESGDTMPVYLIYYIDVAPPTAQSQPAFSANGTYIFDQALSEAMTWKNLAPGEHTFSAQFVNTDNETPLNPPVIAQCTITVPSTVPTSPEIRNFSVIPTFPNPSPVSETPQPIYDFIVQVSCLLHNFKINDDSIGKQNVPGEGHLIYYLDIQPPTIPGQTAIPDSGMYKVSTNAFQLWKYVTPGSHVFSVQVVNNDNTPLETPVIAQIIITLPSSY